jgi:hypothetical protein
MNEEVNQRHTEVWVKTLQLPYHHVDGELNSATRVSVGSKKRRQ